jgi:hypothetical protein
MAQERLESLLLQQQKKDILVQLSVYESVSKFAAASYRRLDLGQTLRVLC